MFVFVFVFHHRTNKIHLWPIYVYISIYVLRIFDHIYIYMCIVARNSPVKADDPPVNHCLEISFLTRK